MASIKKILLSAFLLVCITSCAQQTSNQKEMEDKISKSDEQWKHKLTEEEYQVLRKKGTERAFTGEFWNHHEKGIYICAGCQLELFSSETKFESGSGWPSFYDAISKDNVKIKKDVSFGMVREELVCSKCEGHLGHVFPDGPKPTGLRYCINSVSLDFKKL
ncbi:MAG: peptide-methionine (R)-S-oxide reductase MsrB [Cyclobacteriaceae bacterium]|nr:peptide-methionine (R)-S-oxide reductase MsrB [Cyclobacteriaceae bacterium]